MSVDERAPGLGVLDLVKRAVPQPLPLDADLLDLWELAMELSVRVDQDQGGRGWTRMGELEAHRIALQLLLGEGQFAGLPPSSLALYKPDASGWCYAVEPMERRAILRARLGEYVEGHEPRSTAYRWDFAFLRADAMAAFQLESAAVAAPAKCHQLPVADMKRAGPPPVSAAHAEPTSYATPVQLGWPRTGKGSAVTAAEREELFKMRHKLGMTGLEIGAVCGLSRQRIDELIGKKTAPRAKDWPKDWKPSAALLAECGLTVPGAEAVRRVAAG